MPNPFLVGGLVLRSYGRFKANQDQADAEEKNASFFREQAEFARFAGERSELIFNRETMVLFSQQESAFAKAGVDSESSSLFSAKQALYRSQELNAIREETKMNERLALLRAESAEATAEGLRDPLNNALGAVGDVASIASLF